MLSAHKSYDEETHWTRAEYRIKAWIYNMMHELVQAQVINSLVYKLLLIVETLQFLWYCVHPHFNFLWTVNVSEWLREFLKYLQFDGFLTDFAYSQSVFIAILYIVFSVQLIMSVVIICHMRFFSARKQPSTIMAYSIKALSGYIILLNTVLGIPFYYIYLATFICRTGDPIHGDMQCYKGPYFAHFAAALIGVILLVPASLLAAALCIDLNPWSSSPFAAPKSRVSLLKLFIKIFVCIFFIVDYEGSAGKEFCIAYAVIWLFMLVLRYRQTPYYSKSVFNMTLSLEMLLFWASLVSVFHAFIDNTPIDNIGFLFLWVGAPFIMFTFAAIVNKRRKTYRKTLMKNLKKDTEVEMYITNIISLIEERNNARKRMTLEGILKFHMKTCSNKELGCVCHSLHTEYLKDQDPPEKTWYLWVKSITLEGIARFPKSSRLRILYAYIQREKLHNKFKALFEIMFAHNNKPTLEEEFSIHRYKNLIEEDMMESDMKIAENKGVNVNVIVDFENKFVDFQMVIGAAVDLHLDFWRELQENNPEIQKLQSLGSLITKSVEEVNRHYLNLTHINPNHVKMLKVYGNFLHEIINDEAEGQKVLEKAEYNNRSAMVNRQFLDNERIKYGDNANTCIITVSGEFTSMGIITNTNNEITRILGFNKAELIGQNISSIMPKFLTEIHDSFMQNYFDSSDAKVIAIERTVFPINKDGYIVPCTLMAKVLPTLEDGLKLVGFVKEIDDKFALNKDQDGEVGEEEESHYIMYDSNTGIIHGITYGCKREYGIPSSLVQNADVAMDEFTIDQIFPELVQINLDDLKNSGAVITVLDTTTLGQDFIIEKEGSEASGYDEGDDKEKKYRRAKVKINLFQDDQYGDISLKVFRFVEITEDGDETPNAHNNNGNEEYRKNSSNMVKVRPGDQRSAEEFEGSRLDNQNASEVDSNANNELNEEMRDLKEFKAMISEKTVPKSIRLLRNAVVVIYLFMIGLVCLGLGFYSTLVDEFTNGTTTVSYGYRRHEITAEINYRLRKIQIIASDLITTNAATKNSLAAVQRAKEINLIDNLRTVTLEIGDDQDSLVNLGFPSVETDNVLIESLVQTGPKSETRFFSDAMSQYTSHSTSASNAALDAFVSPSVTDSTRASFFYVRRNGLGPLRIKSEDNAKKIVDFYIERTKSYDSKFEIIMIALIVLICLSEIVLIPIIFSVHKTATKVLSLFGYIPLHEIGALTHKCEKYVQLYLENHRAQQDFAADAEEDNSDRPSKTSRMGDNTYVEVNQNPDMQGSLRAVDQDANASYLVEMSLEDSTRKIHGLRVPETRLMKNVVGPDDIRSLDNEGKLTMENSSKPLKDDYNVSINNQMLLSKSPDAKKLAKEEEKKMLVQQGDEEDGDLANDRPQKLLNSRDNTKSKVIMQFCFIGLLFIAYFIMDYLLEKDSLKNIRSAFTHLQLVSQRMSNARFLHTFTQEVIAEGGSAGVYNYTNQAYTDYRVMYQSRTLSNNNQLKDSSQNSFPNDFDSYLALFNLYEGGNLCDLYYTQAAMRTQCLGIAGGLLTKGLTLTLTRVGQISDDLIKRFANTAGDNAGKTLVLTSPEFHQAEDMIDMIGPIVEASKEKFLSSFKDYINYSWAIARVRFGVFVSVAIIALIIVWVPYLNSLRDKIFRTKGMLNMIPMELITKNANLRSLFINSGDILQAVK